MQTLIRCPNCGSSNVQYDSMKSAPSAGISTPPYIVCKNCGHRFREGDLK